MSVSRPRPPIKSVAVWFLCKLCRESFQVIDEYVEHKKKEHFDEFEKTKCLVFEENTMNRNSLELENPDAVSSELTVSLRNAIFQEFPTDWFDDFKTDLNFDLDLPAITNGNNNSNSDSDIDIENNLIKPLPICLNVKQEDDLDFYIVDVEAESQQRDLFETELNSSGNETMKNFIKYDYQTSSSCPGITPIIIELDLDEAQITDETEQVHASSSSSSSTESSIAGHAKSQIIERNTTTRRIPYISVQKLTLEEIESATTNNFQDKNHHVVNFVCEICKAEFIFHFQLKNHLTTHYSHSLQDNGNKILCKPNLSIDLLNSERPLKFAQSQSQWTGCSKSGEFRESKRNLRRKNEKTPSKIGDRPHQCSMGNCNESFLMFFQLANHMKQCHNREAADVTETQGHRDRVQQDKTAVISAFKSTKTGQEKQQLVQSSISKRTARRNTLNFDSSLKFVKCSVPPPTAFNETGALQTIENPKTRQHRSRRRNSSYKN